MNIEKFRILISETIGEVSVETIVSAPMKAMIVLAHGAGADMNHRFMKKLGMVLADYGYGTFRYNFPFTENGKGRPDPASIAEATVEAAVHKAVEMYPGEPILAGGKSFGGRMTSQWLSKNPNQDLKGLIFYGFPLHPAGKPSVERAFHLKSVTLPMLFLQGSRDSLAQMPLLVDVLKELPTSKLTVLEGADHSFEIGRKDQITELARATDDWVGKLF